MRILLPFINKLSFKKHKIDRQNISYQSSSTFGLLYTDEQKGMVTSMGELKSRLISDGKKISELILITENENNGSERCFKKSDINFFGNWKNDSVVNFFDADFDFLISPLTEINPIIENILLRSKSKCRIGIFNDETSHVFEMMVKVPVGAKLQQRSEALYKYVSAIK